MEPASFEMRIAREADLVLVALRGELNSHGACDFDRTIAEIAADRRPVIVVDLSGLSFVDVSGIAALAAARQAGRPGSGSVLFTNVPVFIEELITMLGIEPFAKPTEWLRHSLVTLGSAFSELAPAAASA
jgi:anti-anti-sigma factor